MGGVSRRDVLGNPIAELGHVDAAEQTLSGAEQPVAV
jgi:hypothetical protein